MGESGGESGGASGGVSRTSALSRALAFFAFAALAFLWPAIAAFPSASYTTADLSQTYSLTLTGPMLRPGNAHLSDPAVEMLPWLEFNASELAAGRLPTWNPWNGAGVPHLANYQSAVFSPFSVPFYVLPLKWALVVAAFAKLVLGALGTWLFLRALGIGGLAAAAGGLIYEFGGHNVLLLAYPHSSVAALFPLGLVAVERAWRAVESRSAVGGGARAGFALVVALMLVAGNPETAAFAISVCALYAIARGVQAVRSTGLAARAAFTELAVLGAASVLGLAISAAQVLPFFEYVSRSTLADSRASGFDGLRSANWPLQFFPDLFGNPGLRYYPRPHLPAPNYEAANTSYFGPLAWMLAFAGAWNLRRRFAAGFFAVLTVVWVLCAYDFEWMRPVMVAFSELTRAPVNRSQLVPLFALAVLAAYALDERLGDERPGASFGARFGASSSRARAQSLAAAFSSVALILALLWLAGGAAERLAAESYAGNVPSGHALRVPPHQAFVRWTVVLGAIAFALFALAPWRWSRRLLAVLLLAALWTQSAWILRPFNALSKDEHVFPRTPAIETLQRELGRERLQVIGEDTLPPQTNMVYGLASIAVYDALWVREADRLYRELFATESNWRETSFAEPRGATLFGVRGLLARNAWPAWCSGLPIDLREEAPATRPLPLAGGSTIAQTFRADRDGLDRVTIALGAEDDPVPAFAELVLDDVASGAVLAHSRVNTHALRESLPRRALPLFPHDVRFASPTGWIVLEFDAQPHSAGREYRLRLEGEPGAWKQGFLAWTIDDPNAAPSDTGGGRALSRDGEPVAGRLCFDFAANVGRDLEVAATLDPFTLYRRRGGPGRFWLAREVRPAADAQAAFAAVVARDFDPAISAIVETPEPALLPAPLAADVELPSPIVLEEDTQVVRLEVEAPADALLVASIAWYPGWRARVDGRPVEPVKTNYAFLGVPLSAGRHEVVFEYDPTSVRIGLWISALSLVLLGAWAWRARRPRAA